MHAYPENSSDGHHDGVKNARSVRFGRLTLDLAARRATADRSALDLSAGQFAVLAALMDNRHTPMSREAIAASTTRSGVAIEQRMVDIHVYRLRQALKQADIGVAVATSWGRGYMMTDIGHETVQPSGPQMAHDFGGALLPA